MRGEILNDLCRLAVYTATPDRLFVYVESPDFLATSLVLDLYHFDLDGDELNLPPAAMARPTQHGHRNHRIDPGSRIT